MTLVGASDRIQWRSTAVTDPSLEGVVGIDNFQHPWFLRKGTSIARSVCKIANLGTAFLISENRLMTNWHVLRRADWAQGRFAIFGYEQSESGGIGDIKQYALNPGVFFHSDEALDVAVVAVDGTPGNEHGFVNIAAPPMLFSDTRVNIIQHPGGGLKMIAIRDNGLKFFDDNILQYWTDTEHGSSGSPLFDDSWQIIGLHYRHSDAGGAGPTTVFYNEGHTMSAILEHLRFKFPGEF